MKGTKILRLLALSATAIYLAFTCVALLKYPLYFSPLYNWLSDLGNPLLNPTGAQYYNLGGALTSFLLIIFFGGLGAWRVSDKKAGVFLGLAQICGICLAKAFMITTLFPLGIYDGMHSAASIALFVTIGCFKFSQQAPPAETPTCPTGYPSLATLLP